MGHSEDMTKTYTHLDSQEVKKMMKDQVYKFEDLPEEKKHELEEQIIKQNNKIKQLENKLEASDKKFDTFKKEVLATIKKRN